MEYQNFTESFPLRTWDNLVLFQDIYSGQKKIYNSTQEKDSAQKNETELYEITQLINSLLGLLVFFKAFGHNIPSNSLSDFTENEVMELNGNTWENVSNSSLNDVLRHLRNALAHGNIIPQEQYGKVEGFEFQDKVNDHSPIHWKLQLENHAIWKIAEALKNMIEPQ